MGEGDPTDDDVDEFEEVKGDNEGEGKGGDEGNGSWTFEVDAMGCWSSSPAVPAPAPPSIFFNSVLLVDGDDVLSVGFSELTVLSLGLEDIDNR